MKITLAHVGGHTGSKDGFDQAVEEYLGRCSRFAHCATVGFRSEAALLRALARQRGRAPAVIVLLDGQGRQMTSEAFAAWLGAWREEGAQEILFAIGPADGWSAEARARAGMVLSLGKMTMAHRLARLVMAEQIYRAVTILTGHPYHVGH